MEQNADAIVLETTKTAHVGFDCLDGGIEPFGGGIANVMTSVVEQTLQVSAQHTDRFFNWL